MNNEELEQIIASAKAKKAVKALKALDYMDCQKGDEMRSVTAAELDAAQVAASCSVTAGKSELRAAVYSHVRGWEQYEFVLIEEYRSSALRASYIFARDKYAI